MRRALIAVALLVAACGGGGGASGDASAGGDAILEADARAPGVDAPAEGLPGPGETHCAAAPSRCGYPDETNTGPAAGTTFTRVPEDSTGGEGWAWEPELGRLRITGANVVVDGIEVHAPVVIDGPNATLSNSRVLVCDATAMVSIRTGSPTDGYVGDGAQVLHNTLGCDGPDLERTDRGVSDVYGSATGVLVEGNDIYGVSNGVTMEREAVVRGNWIHDLGHQPKDHHSGLSNHGGATSIVFELNTVLLDQEAVSGAITVYSDFAVATHVLVTRNLVSGGSYCLYGGDSGGVGGPGVDIDFTYNRLSKIHGQDGHCGAFGEVATYTPGGENDWTGNVWDEDLSAIAP